MSVANLEDTEWVDFIVTVQDSPCSVSYANHARPVKSGSHAEGMWGSNVSIKIWISSGMWSLLSDFVLSNKTIQFSMKVFWLVSEICSAIFNVVFLFLFLSNSNVLGRIRIKLYLKRERFWEKYRLSFQGNSSFVIFISYIPFSISFILFFWI